MEKSRLTDFIVEHERGGALLLLHLFISLFLRMLPKDIAPSTFQNPSPTATATISLCFFFFLMLVAISLYSFFPFIIYVFRAVALFACFVSACACAYLSPPLCVEGGGEHTL